ncbi:MAG: alpha/beta fold hydrolase [Planctomycetes bacterium]|nr:alpha/beta fold hydrolase [Planctomycetota bacterium]
MLKIVTLNDATLAYYDAGQGPPMLFLHGFPLDHTMWRGQLDALADKFRVIAPDLRGFGRSSVTPGTVTMAQHAADCSALLFALGIGNAAVCALSMGGYVAWQLLRQRRWRVERLILCDTRAVADTPEGAAGRHKMADQVLREGSRVAAMLMLPKLFAERTARDQPAVIDQTRETMLANQPEGIAASQRGMAEREDARPLLATINKPTLLIVGQEDQISTVEEMTGMAAAIPGAELFVVPGAGHMAPLEAPAAVNAKIRAFMTS